MKHHPQWLTPLGVVVAVLLVAILLAGIILVPYTSASSPTGYDQSRLHWNTKNTTRFDGDNLGEVASHVSRAVYPDSREETTPDLVMLYAPDDWQTGLLAAPLLHSLNAVLLPITDTTETDLQRIAPRGSDALDGSQIMLLGDADFDTDLTVETRSVDEILTQTGESPQHAILVDPDEPETALLAAPWAAYSGDMIVFDADDAPDDVPLFALGDVDAPEEAITISGRTPAHVAVNFAAYDNEDYPLFGWGFNSDSLTGYRSYTIANPDEPAMALLSANLNVRGKPGPLLWSNERELPTVVNNYVFSQRATFFVTPSEGPFHHFYVLGNTDTISFPAQSQADYAVEIGPYKGKSYGLSGIDAMAAMWVILGIASSLWIAFHSAKFLPFQNWVMKLAWPLLALMTGPFGILLYFLAHDRPIIRREKMIMWDRPLWMQGMVATVSAVGFGATIMIATGYIVTFLGMPMFPNRMEGVFWLGTPMIVTMIINYVAAVVISLFVFQTPMLAMFHGLPYGETLPKALPMVLISMTFAALAMNPGMWWLMMWNIPMMPTEESILWFGVMFFTGFLAFLMAWPANYVLVRMHRKSGLM